jgi:hypothetical protein
MDNEMNLARTIMSSRQTPPGMYGGFLQCRYIVYGAEIKIYFAYSTRLL